MIPPSDNSIKDPEIFHGLSEPAILALCRQDLYSAVMKEKQRRFWQKPAGDALVRRLADCWDSTLFLLDWYCRVTETKRPIPYSSTWNLETQVALESMQQSQKGIKSHNSFIHWRNAGDEVYCGTLYFLVALMDRWVDLVHGGKLVGLASGFQEHSLEEVNSMLRLSVGFSLAYYLLGAVLLDYKAQHLHTLSEQVSPASIENVAQIKKAKADDKKFRRHLYYNTLCRFLGVHVWALALCAALIWILNGSQSGLIMFVAYVGAYSGLLLYQYNKIFSGPHALIPLLIAAIVGFVLGNILVTTMPDWLYNKVIALAVSTWTAALLSFKTAKLGLPEVMDIRMWIIESMSSFGRKRKSIDSIESLNANGVAYQTKKPPSSEQAFHAYSGIGNDAEFSQSELEAFCDQLKAVPKEDCFHVSPHSHPGDQTIAILLQCKHENVSGLILDAFPDLPSLVQRIVLAWKRDRVRIFIVPMRSLNTDGVDLRAMSHYSGGCLTLYIASESNPTTSAGMNVSSNSMALAETLLHAGLETMFGIPHLQAEITESLLACMHPSGQVYAVSECSKRSISRISSNSEALAFRTACRKELLRNLCFGYDCETEWDSLPLEVRHLFLQRCLGSRGSLTNTEISWIDNNVQQNTLVPFFRGWHVTTLAPFSQSTSTIISTIEVMRL
jgi:hypothetical protein